MNCPSEVRSPAQEFLAILCSYIDPDAVGCVVDRMDIEREYGRSFTFPEAVKMLLEHLSPEQIAAVNERWELACEPPTEREFAPCLS